MIPFHYNPSSGPWPVEAENEGTTYTFSGTFTQRRITEERTVRTLNLALECTLWALLGLGLVAGFFSLQEGLKHRNWLFLLSHSTYNLIFWISCLTTLYLWSKRTQQQLDQELLNILKLDGAAPHGTPVDIYHLMNRDAQAAWNRALAQAQARGAKQVAASDLILSLLKDKRVQHAFWRLEASPYDVTTFLTSYLKVADDEYALDTVPFTALQESIKLHNKTIDPLMLLCALAAELPEEHIVQSIFFNINIDLERIETIASWIFNIDVLADQFRLFRKLSRAKPDSEINRGLTAVPTFYLDRYSQDLTRTAKHGALPLALGRADDLNEIFKLFAAGKTNLLIKGPVGSGRTTVINELAYKMAAEQVPAVLEDKRLVKIELSSILASRLKAEGAFLNALQEAASVDNIILVIEDLQMLARTQSSQGLSLLEMLVNFLQNNNLVVIATSTLEDYSDYLRTTPNFDEVFMNYELADLSPASVMLAACVRASLLEAQNRCFFTYNAIESAVELTNLYVKDASQPQKSVAVLVEAATRAKNLPENRRTVNQATIQKIISEKTHIPAQALSQSENEKLLNLEKNLNRGIVGQQQAVRAVAEGLRRARSGLSSGNRPLASFLFLGPTGVGKTEIARQLAKVYFGEEKYLLRLDMSEYRGEDGMTKLLGSETRKTDTPLVKHLKNYPFCLLLLDEFEKASPEIINLFLQVLEDGRLTSGRGELVNMTQCLIIATSNAGTGEIQYGLKLNMTLDQIRTKIWNQELGRFFPPELLNRFDSVVLFSPLSQPEVERITALQLASLSEQLLKKGLKVEFTRDVLREVAENAFDPLMGARPIRRYIQDHIESFIAQLMLSKKLSRGMQVTISLKDGQLTII